jgi:hypothetical protein
MAASLVHSAGPGQGSSRTAPGPRAIVRLMNQKAESIMPGMVSTLHRECRVALVLLIGPRTRPRSTKSPSWGPNSK